MSIFKNKVFLGIVLTFIIAGLSSITGLVSPSTAEWITLVISALTGIGHAAQLVSSSRPQ